MTSPAIVSEVPLPWTSNVAPPAPTPTMRLAFVVSVALASRVAPLSVIFVVGVARHADLVTESERDAWPVGQHIYVPVVRLRPTATGGVVPDGGWQNAADAGQQLSTDAISRMGAGEVEQELHVQVSAEQTSV